MPYTFFTEMSPVHSFGAVGIWAYRSLDHPTTPSIPPGTCHFSSSFHLSTGSRYDLDGLGSPSYFDLKILCVCNDGLYRCISSGFGRLFGHGPAALESASAVAAARTRSPKRGEGLESR